MALALALLMSVVFSQVKLQIPVASSVAFAKNIFVLQFTENYKSS